MTEVRPERRLPDRDENADPLPVQIAHDMAARILDGEFTGRVPSMATLAQPDEYDVSRGTAHRGLVALAAMGYVRLTPGRGYFVTPKARKDAREHAEGHAAEAADSAATGE